jgi:hypothetical protein
VGTVGRSQQVAAPVGIGQRGLGVGSAEHSLAPAGCSQSYAVGHARSAHAEHVRSAVLMLGCNKQSGRQWQLGYVHP